MEEYQSEIHLLSDGLINNSISVTANNIINKYGLNNYPYNSEEEVFEKIGELNLLNEDIYKDIITPEEKAVLEGEILFTIYTKLYETVTKRNKFKKY